MDAVKSADAKPRIQLYDNVKCLLIILVVIGHFTQGYTGVFASINVFIYAFHMPLFIFLSGMFYSPKKIASKATAYICIGILLKGGALLADRLVGGHTDFTLVGGWNVPWFMFVLAVYQVLSYGLRNVPRRFVLFTSVLAACLAGYDKSIGDGLYLSRILVFYPFFVLGQMCDRKKLAEASRRPALRWGGLAVLILWAALCLFVRDKVYLLRYMFVGRRSYAIHEMFQPWGFFWRLFCYAITLVTGFAVLCVVPEGRIPVITTMGNRTLQIYFWHYIIQTLINGYGNRLCVDRPGKILWLMTAVLLAFITGLRPFAFPTEPVLRAAQEPPDMEKQQ